MEIKNEVRCKQCNKLLGKGTVEYFQIQCPRCKFMNNLRGKNSNRLNTPDVLEIKFDNRNRERI